MYIVRVWVNRMRRKATTEYHEFYVIDEAVEYANNIAKIYTNLGDVDYDVTIFESTNY